MLINIVVCGHISFLLNMPGVGMHSIVPYFMSYWWFWLSLYLVYFSKCVILLSSVTSLQTWIDAKALYKGRGKSILHLLNNIMTRETKMLTRTHTDRWKKGIENHWGGGRALGLGSVFLALVSRWIIISNHTQLWCFLLIFKETASAPRCV